VHLTHLLNHCLWIGHFSAPWREGNIITLPKLGKDPKCSQKLCPISLLSTKGKLFYKPILRTIQEHTEESNILIASQFGFRADNNMTLQCMRLTDHVTLNFNNNMSTAAVWTGLEFSKSHIKLIASFLTDRKANLLRQEKLLQGCIKVPYLTQYCTVYM
jgi:hypothetical protein